LFQRLSPSDFVPHPPIDAFTPDLVGSKTKRSGDSLYRRTLILADRRSDAFLTYTPKFKTDFRLPDLKLVRPEDAKADCQRLADPSVPAQGYSAMFVDPDDVPLFCFVAARVKLTEPTEVVPLTLENQRKWAEFFKNAPDNERVLDGLDVSDISLLSDMDISLTSLLLQEKTVTRYHQSAQWLASYVHPTLSESDRRHPLRKDDVDPRVMRYTDAEDPDLEHRERCGVIHLVHGWTQLGHRGDVSVLNVL
jgi:hypothetical protein